MSYGVLIRPEAELDIQDAFEWYEAQALGLGSEFIRAVDTCLSSMGRNPLAYPILYKQARRALIRRFPHSILLRL
jgi:plasmid stabilization system protein ParE